MKELNGLLIPAELLDEIVDAMLSDEDFIRALLGQKDDEKVPKIADLIEEVRYNGPAIIVFWSDGTKTVSVCSDADVYDAEKGLAMCMLKYLLGNASYNEVFEQFIPEHLYDQTDEEYEKALEIIDELLNTKKLTDAQRWAIEKLLG